MDNQEYSFDVDKLSEKLVSMKIGKHELDEIITHGAKKFAKDAKVDADIDTIRSHVARILLDGCDLHQTDVVDKKMPIGLDVIESDTDSDRSDDEEFPFDDKMFKPASDNHLTPFEVPTCHDAPTKAEDNDTELLDILRQFNIFAKQHTLKKYLKNLESTELEKLVERIETVKPDFDNSFLKSNGKYKHGKAGKATKLDRVDGLYNLLKTVKFQ